MTSRTSCRFAVGAVLAAVVAASGCDRDLSTLGPAPFPTDADVFLDTFGSGVNFQAFVGSKVDALSFDATQKFRGTAALKITVPSAGDPSGSFAGGAFPTNVPRDLSGYNALTFYARASQAATLDVAGLGNDNTGTSRFVAERRAISLTTSWTKYIIPIPLPTKLVQEAGLFFFATGPQNGVGFDIWFDDIQFENLGTIVNPRPAIAAQALNAQVGGTAQVEGTVVTFDVGGSDVTVDAAPGYFTFASSDATVATVGADGVIRAIGLGTAEITAKLGTLDAAGTVTLDVGAAPAGPTVAAPAPMEPAGDVISLFSNAYTNVPVDTWSAGFDNADVADVQVAGDDVKLYTNLVFAGVEFVSNPVDATAMTHFHMDIWTPDPTAAPAAFRIKLVDFGADGAFGGGDDVEHELTFDDASAPPLVTGNWVSFDIELADFTGLVTRGHLAQLIISGDPNTVYVDNAYFYRTSGPTAPTVAAPIPTVPAGDVVSLFSNAYTDVTVDTWSAGFDQADVADVQVAGDDVKLYTNLVFSVAEFTSQPVDASAMTDFHMDIWTPDPTAAPAAFRIKLVDFGADGAFGGGDDVEHELTFDDASTPPLVTGNWVSFDIPLTAFTGLVTTGHLAQLILSGDPNTVYVDNVYFYRTSGPTAPTVAAPTPTVPAGDVVSMFSNAYTDVSVDTWSAVWDNADVADVQVAGDDVKLYTNLVFAGIEAVSQPIDASAMTDFHLDIWTPDPTAAPAVFKIKLVDFGADGAFGGGDDAEHELTFDDASTPPLVTGNWVSFDLPLSAFTNLNTTGHIAQMIISGDPNTVYVDNVYFYRTAPTTPTVAAPTPSFAAGDVVSLFSNAYTDVTVDTWSAVWDNADVADVQVAGDDVKLYTNLVFAGIEAVSQPIDASAMTHFYLDFWTPDPTAAPAVFKIKLVDVGADGAFGGGDDVEHELTFDDASTPPLATGGWVTFDIPLSAFVNLATTGHIAQLIVSGDPNTVYVDNVLFHR